MSLALTNTDRSCPSTDRVQDVLHTSCVSPQGPVVTHASTCQLSRQDAPQGIGCTWTLHSSHCLPGHTPQWLSAVAAKSIRSVTVPMSILQECFRQLNITPLYWMTSQGRKQHVCCETDLHVAGTQGCGYAPDSIMHTAS